jgi:hypothetical protein
MEIQESACCMGGVVVVFGRRRDQTGLADGSAPVSVARGRVFVSYVSALCVSPALLITHSVQTGCCVHSAAYAVDTGSFSPGVKRPEREKLNDSPMCGAESKTVLNCAIQCWEFIPC